MIELKYPDFIVDPDECLKKMQKKYELINFALVYDFSNRFNISYYWAFKKEIKGIDAYYFMNKNAEINGYFKEHFMELEDCKDYAGKNILIDLFTFANKIPKMMLREKNSVILGYIDIDSNFLLPNYFFAKKNDIENCLIKSDGSANLTIKIPLTETFEKELLDL
ncbi:MAG: hypothetical protein PHN56_00795 [Candidatus Nanoarchaeia archaeon]|nr:hypothetical protein [Candidatus Nanoarchaeia archaeon]